MRRLITFLSVFFALSLSAKVNVSIPDDLSFKAAHPRLMVNDDDFKQKFAAFTFTVPAGKTVTVKTTLKPITK